MATAMVKCRECGDVKREHARSLCFACYMRQYRAQRREEESRVRPLIEQLEKEQGDPTTFACYWCDLYNNKTNTADVWFMGEAACIYHIELAKEWIGYVTRKPL